jgi:hypothetical protein
MRTEWLFVVVHGFVAVVLDEFVVFGGFEVFAEHFGDETEGSAWQGSYS